MTTRRRATYSGEYELVQLIKDLQMGHKYQSYRWVSLGDLPRSDDLASQGGKKASCGLWSFFDRA